MPTPPVRSTANRVLAWSGAHAEAVKLLESLTRDYPGIGPAAVSRDPSFSVPLESNAQFRALAQKLEAKVRAKHVTIAADGRLMREIALTRFRRSTADRLLAI